MNRDTLTTIAGGVVAAGTAAGTIFGQMQPGTSMHSQDYINLGIAVAMAIWGFFTNKK